MNEMRQFEKWAQRARWESPPVPDVSARVLRRTRSAQRAASPADGWFIAFTAASAAAALVCAWAGYAAWAELSAPWQGWLAEITGWGII